MKNALRSPKSLLEAVDLGYLEQELPETALSFATFVPQPFLQRIEKGNPADPLLRQVLPQIEEGDSPARFVKDPLGEAAATLKDGLIQKYRKRVLVIASSACAVNCRYCFRRHFPYNTAAIGKERWQQIFEAIAADESLNEVILSGGDPLTMTDETLDEVLLRIGEIPHIERLRIHSRLPIVIPQRATPQLLNHLKRFRDSREGRQVIVVVHCNHANEIDRPVAEALRKIGEFANQTLNQSVLLKGVNDDAETLIRLSERLLQCGVMPYYLHQLDPILGAAHFEVPVEVGVDLIHALRAQLPGFAVPRFVQELEGEPSKTVLA